MPVPTQFRHNKLPLLILGMNGRTLLKNRFPDKSPGPTLVNMFFQNKMIHFLSFAKMPIISLAGYLDALLSLKRYTKLGQYSD